MERRRWRVETKCEAEIDDAAPHLIFLHKDRRGGAPAARGTIRSRAPLHQQSYGAGEKNVIGNDTNLIPKLSQMGLHN